MATVNYFGAFTGNRGVTFTSSVKIVNSGTPIAPVWKTVAGTKVTSLTASFDVVDSNGVFERSEGLDFVGAADQYYFGYSSSFGGGVITTDGVGSYYY